MESPQVRVFLADPHEEARRGLRRFLEEEAGLTVVGEGEPNEESYAQVLASEPDVMVACVGENPEAVQLCRDVRSVLPSVKCIVLTAFDEDDALLRAVLTGAADYVSSHDSERDIMRSILTVAGGGRPLDDKVVERARDAQRWAEMADLLEGLTDRQRRVAELVAQGLTNPEIADELGLSVNTVRNYLARVMVKLDAHNRVEVATFMAKLAAVRHTRNP